MIPCRVTMQGWMRYRERQTADFEGARLLAICGENGAGKSAIFDAITFALFGKQRLSGSRDDSVTELITEDQNRLRVEFEFEAEGTRYLVWRERNRKGPGKQGLSFWDDEVNDWAELTDKARNLEAQLGTIVRMTPEAFTSSFLLQQGAATEFLEAKASERFAIVRSLIALEAYEKLEERARKKANAELNALKAYEQQLTQYDGVDEETVEELRRMRDDAARAERETAAFREAQARRATDAREYAARTADIAELDRRIAEADELLAHTASIEADAARHAAVGAELAVLGRVAAALADAAAAEARAEEAAAALATLEAAALEREQADADRALADASDRLEAGRAALEIAQEDERVAADFAAAAAAILTLRTEVAALADALAAGERELAAGERLEAEEAGLRALVAALPALDALAQARARVEERGKGDPRARLAALDRETVALNDERARLEAEAVEREAEAIAAQERAVELRKEAATLQAQLAQRQESAREPVCSRCGQAIDPNQAQREVDELSIHLRAAREAAQAATRAATATRTALDQARTAAREVEGRRDALATERQRADARVHALDDATAHAEECARAFTEQAPPALLAEAPADAEATALRAASARHAGARARLDQVHEAVQSLHRRRGALNQARETHAQRRAALAEHEDMLGGRLDHVEAAPARHAAARERLDLARAERAAAQADHDRARERLDRTAAALAAGRERQHAAEEATRRHGQEAAGHRRAAEAHADALDPAIRASALADPDAVIGRLRDERDALIDAPARLEHLRAARASRNTWAGERRVHTEAAERVPPKHRVPEAEAAAALAAAERDAAAAQEGYRSVQGRLAREEEALKIASKLRDHAARAERRAGLLRRLAQYLDRSHLQGLLVKDALTTVVSHANAFLDRLTGGSLQLVLERGAVDEFEVKAVDAGSMREARSVRVLSGSQKFRCAVAIASGIGQYAGAGGMRSIVIDEGFGSLDRDGQQAIIAELKNLAEHMERVIVVSHLDAFTNQDHFPDQLRVIRGGDGSRIERAG